MMNFHFLACELSNVGVIPLGHTGEHNATRVTIDATEWQEEYPNGALALLVRNPNGIVYPAQVETNGYVLTWNITRDETAIAGNGEIELILSADGYVVKSARCTTQIDAALSQNADDPPTGTPEWVSELLGSLDNIKDANDTIEAAKTATDAAADAAKAANEAAKASVYSPYIDTATQNWMVWSTETKAYKDTGIKAVGPQGETGPKGETGSIENLAINGKAPDGSGAVTLTAADVGAATAEEVSQLKDDIGGVSDIISDAWSADKTYSVGDYCIYNNALWQCAVSVSGAGHAPSEGAAEWQKRTVAAEIKATKAIANNLIPLNVGSTGESTIANIDISNMANGVYLLFNTWYSGYTAWILRKTQNANTLISLDGNTASTIDGNTIKLETNTWYAGIYAVLMCKI